MININIFIILRAKEANETKDYVHIFSNYLGTGLREQKYPEEMKF